MPNDNEYEPMHQGDDGLPTGDWAPDPNGFGSSRADGTDHDAAKGVPQDSASRDERAGAIADKVDGSDARPDNTDPPYPDDPNENYTEDFGPKDVPPMEGGPKPKWQNGSYN